MYLFAIFSWVTGPTTLAGAAVGAGEYVVEFEVVEIDNAFEMVNSPNARTDRENILGVGFALLYHACTSFILDHSENPRHSLSETLLQ